MRAVRPGASGQFADGHVGHDEASTRWTVKRGPADDDRSVSLLVLVIGFVVWLGTVHVVRVTVAIDRRLAGWRSTDSSR